MKEIDVHLPFETIENLRDLAGIPAADGKVIVPGKLLRAGSLHKASDLELETLKQMGVDTVVDFRTNWEIATSQDRLPEGAQLYHLPVLHEAEIKDEAGSQAKLLEEALKNSEKMMEGIYAGMLTDESGIEAYKQFFELLLKEENTILWHCSQGKDRTGMAAALLLEALGVDEKLIKEEYMQTNLYMTKKDMEAKVINSMLFKDHRQIADEDVNNFLFVKEEFFDTARKAVFDQYGSWDGYLEKALGIDSEKKEALRQKYLK